MPASPSVSLKPIPSQDRLIFALDFETNAEAQHMVNLLGDTVRFYKVGLELFMAGAGYEMVDWLTTQGKQVFVDLKFFDVPQTVGAAVKQLAQHGATFATVHGNDAILSAAVANKGPLKILAVTVLTSLDRQDLHDLGFACDVEALVLSRAKRAFALGCDGVISSGLEAKALRAHVDEKLIVITPGIRPVDNQDDQKRTVDVATAFQNGADYIVVGRPIKLAPDPQAVASQMQATIAELFGGEAPS
jgi:orotidine-5'-phosphate decarboxylase